MRPVDVFRMEQGIDTIRVARKPREWMATSRLLLL